MTRLINTYSYIFVLPSDVVSLRLMAYFNFCCQSQSKTFWHALFLAASSCCPYHNDGVFQINNAPWFSWWWNHLSWCPLLCNSYDSVQWLHWSLDVGHKASCSLQAQGPALLPTMGIYTSFLALEHSNLTLRVRNVGACNILCGWLWSSIYKVVGTIFFPFFFWPERRIYLTFESWSFFICRFLGQFLLLFFLHQTSLALFRVMASLGRNMIVANTFGSFALLVVMILGGFIITKGWASLFSYW